MNRAVDTGHDVRLEAITRMESRLSSSPRRNQTGELYEELSRAVDSLIKMQQAVGEALTSEYS